jgi:hypothetical protein
VRRDAENVTRTFVGPICPHGRWQTIRDQTSIGATKYVGPRTIQQCLDYCNNNTNCLAVDIDMNEVPLGCWPHFSASDLFSSNTFDQPGTNQYRLNTRCTQATPGKRVESVFCHLIFIIEVKYSVTPLRVGVPQPVDI